MICTNKLIVNTAKTLFLTFDCSENSVVTSITVKFGPVQIQRLGGIFMSYCQWQVKIGYALL